LYFFQFNLLCLFFGLERDELPMLVLFLTGVKYSLLGSFVAIIYKYVIAPAIQRAPNIMYTIVTGSINIYLQ
tara:strand:+ start:222 stop:437 length:216 start_codon:yes stop_codon:yes gene_type:complete